MIKIIFIWLICGFLAFIFGAPIIILNEWLIDKKKINKHSYSNICNTNLFNLLIRGPLALLGLIIVFMLDIIYIVYMIFNKK